MRTCLPMQGTWVWSLVWEDSTCCGETKPVHHNYWAHRACESQLLSPLAATTEAHAPRTCAPQQQNSLTDSVGEGEGGKIWENGIETCKITCMKRVASPGSMHDTGCLGLVHWDDPEGWYGEGGGFRMGNTYIPVADSFWYLAKLIQLCKV